MSNDIKPQIMSYNEWWIPEPFVDELLREVPNKVIRTFWFPKPPYIEKYEIKGNKVLLDLDVLIQEDLYPYLYQYNFNEPRFTESTWQDKDHVMETLHRASCLVNSSFVTWKDDQLNFLYEFYIKHKIIIEEKYNSFDRFLFANFYDILKYHEDNVVYSYSFDKEPKKFKKDFLISIFLTSHGEGIELHDADEWAKEMWCRYDK